MIFFGGLGGMYEPLKWGIRGDVPPCKSLIYIGFLNPKGILKAASLKGLKAAHERDLDHRKRPGCFFLISNREPGFRGKH